MGRQERLHAPEKKGERKWRLLRLGDVEKKQTEKQKTPAQTILDILLPGRGVEDMHSDENPLTQTSSATLTTQAGCFSLISSVPKVVFRAIITEVQ